MRPWYRETRTSKALRAPPRALRASTSSEITGWAVLASIIGGAKNLFACGQCNVETKAAGAFHLHLWGWPIGVPHANGQLARTHRMLVPAGSARPSSGLTPRPGGPESSAGAR